MEAVDALTIYNHGNYYRDGRNGFSQDYVKALELWHKAAELGCFKAYNSIGYVYHFDRGVEVDLKKAVHYYELAAMMGSVIARCNLGVCVERRGQHRKSVETFHDCCEGWIC